MTERLQTIIAEIAAAGALTILSMTPQERALAHAKMLQLSSKMARRIAEECLRYAIRTENRAARVVAP